MKKERVRLSFTETAPNSRGEVRLIVSLRGKRPSDAPEKYTLPLAELTFYPLEIDTLVAGVDVEEVKVGTSWSEQDSAQLQEWIASDGLKQLFEDVSEEIESLKPQVWVLPAK